MPNQSSPSDLLPWVVVFLTSCWGLLLVLALKHLINGPEEKEN